jgi:hypothetical protein
MNTEQENAVLCYLDENWAYFTTQDLDKQWGDDWNDAPYEHNAGPPYLPCWHNEPKYINHPKRGLCKTGELCMCNTCKNDWNEDGTPKFKIFKIAYEVDFNKQLPSDSFSGNSRWSVQEINARKTPWLIVNDKYIYAGTTLKQFCEIIKQEDGIIYMPI